jgi:hypothetical protein
VIICHYLSFVAVMPALAAGLFHVPEAKCLSEKDFLWPSGWHGTWKYGCMLTSVSPLHRPLVRKLAWVLALKLAVLVALWWGFVREQHVPVNDAVAASQLLGAPAPTSTQPE